MLTAKADVFRSDKFYFEPGNKYRQPAYTNLDASLAWTLSRPDVTFTLWGRNLTDEFVPLASFLTGTAAAYNWAPPLTYGFAIGARF